MKSAILVDTGYLAYLEHLAEEIRQVATTDSPANARRHLLAALEISREYPTC